MVSSSNLPPGFRFHPTDEELIMYYLRNQLMSRPCPVSIIPELDDWVLCRIYKKKSTGRASEAKMEDCHAQASNSNDDDGASDPRTMKFPRTYSISNLWELECLGSISQLLGDTSYNSTYGNQNATTSPGIVPRDFQLEEIAHQCTDSTKFQGNNQFL
ncbi:hypothetical protein RJ639_002431 [Escallonia herrerae]|uniref:NAC domain-containing protein n=1 Tax=Escallonia herrerae TaxID=1293975 RepID=A0AA88XHB5_9ASTE|nr:hypothetical protein RJ639_002431 [Escallonia herrerae]